MAWFAVYALTFSAITSAFSVRDERRSLDIEPQHHQRVVVGAENEEHCAPPAARPLDPDGRALLIQVVLIATASPVMDGTSHRRHTSEPLILLAAAS